MAPKSQRQKSLERDGYRHLEFRPQTDCREPYLKGMGRVRVSDVVYWVRTNQRPPEALAREWGLPLEAIEEALRWADDHPQILTEEAKREWADFLRWVRRTGYLKWVQAIRGELPKLPFQARKR
jgi:uncharacterized protein (DUF433 family)